MKQKLWGQFWTDGYFITTIGQHGNEAIIRQYVKQGQVQDYKPLHVQQPRLFD